MKLPILLACLVVPALSHAQSKQERVAQAILNSKPARVKLEGGQVITLSTQKAERYVMAVVNVTQAAEKRRDLRTFLPQQAGESPSAWAARLGRDTSIVRALAAQQFKPAEYVALGVQLHSAWESAHRRKPLVAPNPQALAWVAQNELALQSLATVDGKHIPWPDGSVDGKGIRDSRVW